MNPHLFKTSSNELIAELESKEAFGRGAEPWEIANIILFLASDLSSYMTGEVISASSQRAQMEKLAYQLWKKDDDSLETFKELLLKNLRKDKEK